MTLRSSAMALVNAAHRSLVRLSLKLSPQELRRPRFSFCLYLSNSVASSEQRRLPTKSAAKPNVPVKRSRAAPPAAAPSRWPLYRRTPLRLSTRFLKVFRQPPIFYRARDLRAFRPAYPAAGLSPSIGCEAGPPANSRNFSPQPNRPRTSPPRDQPEIDSRA